MQHWFFCYKWREDANSPWREAMEVFKGSFSQLVIMAAIQPEEWVITFVKEINEIDFAALDGGIV